MEITEVKVFPVREEKLKAFVSVVFDQCFMVNDIKIIQGRQGMFISMPSRKKKNGEFKDVAHPLNNETRQRIEAEILTEYERVLEERAAGQSAGPPGERPQERRRERSRERAKERSKEAPGAESRETVKGERPPEASENEEESAKNAEDAETAEKEKTLEEVEEMHLRDSFWTVP